MCLCICLRLRPCLCLTPMFVSLSVFVSVSVCLHLHLCARAPLAPTPAPSPPLVECHPYFPQQRLLAFCTAHRVLMTAYSPLGTPGAAGTYNPADQPRLLEDPVVVDVARARGVSAGAVLIAFAIARGIAVIPKSTSEARLRENFAAASLCLSAGDIARLLALDRKFRFCTMKHDVSCAEHPFKVDEEAL